MELGEYISNPLSSSLKPPSTASLWSNPKRSQRTSEPADRVHQVGLPEDSAGQRSLENGCEHGLEDIWGRQGYLLWRNLQSGKGEAGENR